MSMPIELKEQIIESLADCYELSSAFSRITLVQSQKPDFLACVNVENREFMLNITPNNMTPEELVKHVKGIASHESLHVNRFLLIPGSSATSNIHKKRLSSKGVQTPQLWLNIVYDFMAHKYANEGHLPEPYRSSLNSFLTFMRNKTFAQDPTDPMLSLYPSIKPTPVQESIKSIIQSNQLNVVEKAYAISQLFPSPPKQPPQSSPNGQPSNDSNSQPSDPGQPSDPSQPSQPSDSQQPSQPSEPSESSSQSQPSPIPSPSTLVDDSDSFVKTRQNIGSTDEEEITYEVREQHEINEAVGELLKSGISEGSAKSFVKWLKSEKCREIPSTIMNAVNSIKTILTYDPNLTSKSKNTKSGHRMNGHRPIRDFHELSENPESLASEGRYDPESVRVPRKIHRKESGALIIIRDVSGSINHGHTGKVVRDLTLALISRAKREKHKVAIIEFASGVKVYPFTQDYEDIMLKSAYIKSGSSTHLHLAHRKLSEMLSEHQPMQASIFIITDSEIATHYTEDGKILQVQGMKIQHPRFSLTALVNNEQKNYVQRTFKEYIKNNNGEVVFVSPSTLSTLCK